MSGAIVEMDVDVLALERNVALMAGAGAGKTFNLVSMCLHLLGGARENGSPLRPSQLWMLTFTDKAAAEMRSRLRQRLDGLARGEENEDGLRRSFEQGGRPFPLPDFWRRTRDALGEATIGTFHSLCAHLLRRAPPGTGTDPNFRLLEEREAADVVRETAERLVLDALERDDPGAMDLCRELGFMGRGGRGTGLVDHLCAAFAKVREEGLEPEGIRISDQRVAREDFELALSQLSRCVAQATEANRSKRGPFASPLADSARALEGMSLENFLEPDRFPLLRSAILGVSGQAKRKSALGEALRAVKYEALGQSNNGKLGLRDFYAGWRVVRHEKAFRALLVALHQRHRQELNRKAALDFSELLIRARDLLRDRLAVRAEFQSRVRALLVDEFQDTNGLQLELVMLLAEKRLGGPRPSSPPSKQGELPLEPGLLCAVGDRKQSIYEFRGADVSVFERLAGKIESEGGARARVRANRRSSPALLAFFNGVFGHLMRAGPEPREYEVVYQADGDDQTPVRSSARASPCVDWVVFPPGETSEDCRAQDAEGVARRIRAILGDPSERLVEEGGSLRNARGGDIAVLFRRFTYVEVYRQALIRHGVPHRIIRGRGFYGAQEVLDIASMLSLISDPSDAIAFAAVLRSPLVCVSDATLLKLAGLGGGRLSLKAVDPQRLGTARLPEGELERLRRFLALYGKLRRERDRLGIRALTRIALEETGYRVTIAGIPFGEQALANLDKLVEMAGRWDEVGRGGCAAFARDLLGLADADPLEAQADTLDALDPRAVQLLTIHQAKGLEWPIVFVPDMAAQRGRSPPSAIYDRREGLALKPWIPDETEPVRSPRYARVCSELSRREEAEYLRLLYVAFTRARDHLVLSGQTTRQSRTWRALVGSVIETDLRVRHFVREVRAEEIALPPPRHKVDSGADERERVEQALQRVRRRAPLVPFEAVLPVTHLQDYFLCPRRYLYAHRIGLSEFPLVLEIDRVQEAPPLGGRSASDRRQQGTIAHRLLELIDLNLAGRDDARSQETVKRLLWEQGIDPNGSDAREIAGWVGRFLATSFAGRMRAAGEARVHRELPFLLRLESPDGMKLHLKGQIDLLFEDEEGGATVIDYKASARHPAGLEPYAFQLDCYALAARHFVKQGVQIRTGIAFLQQSDPEPEIQRVSGNLDKLERDLIAAASGLLKSSHQWKWPGLPREGCENIRCGYQYRCHASVAAV